MATGRVEGVSHSPLSSPSTDLSVFADLPNLSGTTLLNKKNTLKEQNEMTT